jgi:hypothetical protein
MGTEKQRTWQNKRRKNSCAFDYTILAGRSIAASSYVARQLCLDVVFKKVMFVAKCLQILNISRWRRVLTARSPIIEFMK